MRTISIITLIISITVLGCKKESVQTPTPPPTLNLNFTTAPLSVPTGVKFAADISYNNSPNSKFDIFLPPSGVPTSIVVFIHGGGFVGAINLRFIQTTLIIFKLIFKIILLLQL
jgi:hypothetical protein